MGVAAAAQLQCARKWCVLWRLGACAPMPQNNAHYYFLQKQNIEKFARIYISKARLRMRLARFRLSQMSAAPAAAKAICICAHLLLLRFCCNYTTLLCFVGLCVPRKQLTSQKTPTQPPNCRVCNNSTKKNTKSLATLIYLFIIGFVCQLVAMLISFPTAYMCM